VVVGFAVLVPEGEIHSVVATELKVVNVVVQRRRKERACVGWQSINRYNTRNIGREPKNTTYRNVRKE